MTPLRERLEAVATTLETWGGAREFDAYAAAIRMALADPPALLPPPEPITEASLPPGPHGSAPPVEPPSATSVTAPLDADALCERLSRGFEDASEFTVVVDKDDLRAAIALIRPGAAEREALNNANDHLHRIQQWCEAYPVEVFQPVDIRVVRKKFGDDGLFSRLHAEWARYIVTGIAAIAAKGRALAGDAPAAGVPAREEG